MEGAARSWLWERLGVDTLVARLSAQRVPKRSVSHYTGGVLIFLFLLQVGTGILLMLPYRVDAQHAHASVEAIVGQVPFGALMRGLHAWASHLFVATVLVHFAAALLLRSYRAPNELLWLLGLLLLVAGVGMAFTGVILPWNESGYLQARVSSEMLGQGPIFGPFVRRLLRGGEEISPWTLNHAYGFHTGVLPAVTTLLVLLHAVVVQRRAASSAELADGTPVYPDYVLRLAAVCVGVMSVAVTLATFVHVPTGEAADLRAVVTDVTPPWYLLAVHDLLGHAPPWVLGVPGPKFVLGALSLVAAFIAALPVLDRRGSRITLFAGLALIALWGLLTAHAAL